MSATPMSASNDADLASADGAESSTLSGADGRGSNGLRSPDGADSAALALAPSPAAAELRADLVAMSTLVSWAVWINVAAGLLLHAAGAVPSLRPWSVVVFAAAIQLTALTTRLWAPTVRRPLALYFGFHLLDVAWVSAILAAAGGWTCPGAPLFYGLIVINGGGVGALHAHVLASASALGYAAMLLLERWSGVRSAGVAPIDQVAAVVMMWLGLHLVAGYTSRLAELLRSRRVGLVNAYRELERQRGSLEDQVRVRTDRLRSVIHGLTHDLKNPVNAIHLLADMLLRQGDRELSHRVKDGLQRISAQAANSEDKIHALLDLFRIEWRPDPFEWVELQPVAARVIEALRPRIDDKGARVELRVLPRTWGQAAKLARVLSSLIENAVNHVAQGAGVIVVEGGVDGADVWVQVRDNGVGIPAQYHEAIFDLFRRVPEAEQLVDGEPVAGTGVGLTLVRQVVEQHGGRVSVRSIVGHGASFEVRLPTTPVARAA